MTHSRGDRGAAFVAYGDEAYTEVRQAVSCFQAYHNIPVTVVTDRTIKGATVVNFADPGYGARRAKLNLNNLIAYSKCLYMDADTRARGNVEAMFAPLDDGWDLVITHSQRQIRNENLWHLGSEERGATYKEIDEPFPVILQGGVFAYNRETTRNFFQAWREEWERWHGPDQGALLRALKREPVKVWLMGRPFNAGYLVEHRCGQAAKEAERWRVKA